jgi:hypothetical protein
MADPVKRQQSPDTVDVSGPLAGELRPLARQAFGVFDLRLRDGNFTARALVASDESPECDRHCLDVDAVGLRAPATTRNSKARRVEHVRLNPTVDQVASQPETVVSYLIANGERHLRAGFTTRAS